MKWTVRIGVVEELSFGVVEELSFGVSAWGGWLKRPPWAKAMEATRSRTNRSRYFGFIDTTASILIFFDSI